MFEMMYNQETFGQFFEPLVGNTAVVEDSKAILAAHVNAYPHDDPNGFHASDPYVRLREGVRELLSLGTDNIGSSHDKDTYVQNKVRRAGALGLSLTVAVTKAVGDTYSELAVVPQNVHDVRHNSRRALRGLYSIAFLDSKSAKPNVEAFKRGESPPSTVMATMINRLRFRKAVHSRKHRMGREAFTVGENEEGQLDIRLKYKDAAGKQPQYIKCPATETRVGPPNQKRSALLTLMTAISDVAIAEIYPHYFELADDQN